MWVPVRFNCSRRNSTSSVRGSTTASRRWPFTRIRTSVFSTPDIFVSSLHTLTAGSAHGDSDGTLHQRRHQHSLVIRGTAHIALRLGSVPHCVRSPLDGLIVEFLAGQFPFRRFRANRGQPHAAQYDTGVFAHILAVEGELNGRAR